MFLDLNDATTFAEKLGSKKYSSFLNDFFNDLDPAFTKTKGRVFQYVGDEVVIIMTNTSSGLIKVCETGDSVNVRESGMQNSPQPITVYASMEVHSSNQKAIELLGLGNKCLRSIPVNEDFTINLDALKSAIASDREAGIRPICIIGNAGTINTG